MSFPRKQESRIAINALDARFGGHDKSGLHARLARGDLRRLAALGARHVFSVPGNYSAQFLITAQASGKLVCVGTTNEMEAGYAADAQARLAAGEVDAALEVLDDLQRLLPYRADLFEARCSHRRAGFGKANANGYFLLGRCKFGSLYAFFSRHRYPAPIGVPLQVEVRLIERPAFIPVIREMFLSECNSSGLLRGGQFFSTWESPMVVHEVKSLSHSPVTD